MIVNIRLLQLTTCLYVARAISRVPSAINSNKPYLVETFYTSIVTSNLSARLYGPELIQVFKEI